MPTVTVLVDDKVGNSHKRRMALVTDLPVSGVINAVVRYLRLPRYTFFGRRLHYWFNRPYTEERLEGNMTLAWADVNEGETLELISPAARRIKRFVPNLLNWIWGQIWDQIKGEITDDIADYIRDAVTGGPPKHVVTPLMPPGTALSIMGLGVGAVVVVGAVVTVAVVRGPHKPIDGVSPTPQELVGPSQEPGEERTAEISKITLTPTSSEPTDTPRPDQCIATATTNVNIRTGPTTRHPVVSYLPEGNQAEITGHNGDHTWWQINHSGWVSAPFVTISGSCDNVPTASFPPPPTFTPTATATRTPTVTISPTASFTPTLDVAPQIEQLWLDPAGAFYGPGADGWVSTVRATFLHNGSPIISALVYFRYCTGGGSCSATNSRAMMKVDDYTYVAQIVNNIYKPEVTLGMNGGTMQYWLVDVTNTSGRKISSQIQSAYINYVGSNPFLSPTP